MAKIYFKRYNAKIEAGELTLAEAIEAVRTEVPARWADAVVALLEAAHPQE